MTTRINKYLAECGVASRRSAENFITAGKVKVNGKVITDLATKISDDDIVELNDEVVQCQSNKVYIIMNKPKGVITTCDDQFGRKTVLDVLGDIGKRVFPVGRLDYATEGLLLLTNDGEFARTVTHPSSEIKKTYAAVLDQQLSSEQLKQLCDGVIIDGVKTHKAAVRRIQDKTVEITISEGRNRQVRKMFEAVGARVRNLKRVSIGSLTLGNLKSGEWRYIKKPKL